MGASDPARGRKDDPEDRSPSHQRAEDKRGCGRFQASKPRADLLHSRCKLSTWLCFSQGGYEPGPKVVGGRIVILWLQGLVGLSSQPPSRKVLGEAWSPSGSGLQPIVVCSLGARATGFCV